ncbi:MAG: electron transfer flavoprotein subunit beta/FixA family protein [Bryobacterales bacterium]|nr:electron transfer flavoprotein subunit beta/FixA family protein [Bryobacterales bacterium]
MTILVCVKRVPDTGPRLEVAQGEKTIETRNLGFTISPHEECAVEEAVQLVEKLGGAATVLTVGPSEAEEQLRDALAKGIDRGVLIETDDRALDASQTAAAIAAWIQSQGKPFDLILFGNESADAANYQVPIRVAHLLDLPCVTGIKRLDIQPGRAVTRRDIGSGFEVYDVQLPAVVAVKEGLNLPRHPSLRGTMAARKKPIERVRPPATAVGLELVRLSVPPANDSGAEILGQGKAAAPRIAAVLEQLGLLK